jgi:hypothetical protein
MTNCPSVRLLPILSAVSLVGLCLSACGSAGKSPTSPRTQTQSNGELKNAEGFDGDDAAILDYGRPASPAERQAIAALVEDYYQAAADGDGARACSLLAPVRAETVPEEFGAAPDLAHLRARTCAAVLSEYFKLHRHEQVEKTKLEVTSVRVGESLGLVVVRFATIHQPHMTRVRLEHGRWRIREPSDTKLP